MFEFTKVIIDVVNKIADEVVFDYFTGGIKNGKVYKLHPDYYVQLYPDPQVSGVFCSVICYRPETFIKNSTIKPSDTEPTVSINRLLNAIKAELTEIIDISEFDLDYHESFEYITRIPSGATVKSTKSAYVVNIKSHVIKNLLDEDFIGSVVNTDANHGEWDSTKLLKELICAVIKAGETTLNNYGKC